MLLVEVLYNFNFEPLGRLKNVLPKALEFLDENLDIQYRKRASGDVAAANCIVKITVNEDYLVTDGHEDVKRVCDFLTSSGLSNVLVVLLPTEFFTATSTLVLPRTERESANQPITPL